MASSIRGIKRNITRNLLKEKAREFKVSMRHLKRTMKDMGEKPTLKAMTAALGIK